MWTTQGGDHLKQQFRQFLCGSRLRPKRNECMKFDRIVAKVAEEESKTLELDIMD